ncbi:MAG: ABC transporter ATP-binding protein [Thermodesulfobacteriota bacterium]|nr:ABC transporter ATP-binding protein [Thermodesulfobacteriota bacterium]
MASLRLKNVSKRFGKLVALSRINFHVGEGEFCVLLGPSGCGKSTLLEIVAGLTHQDGGTVFIDNRPVDKLSPRERDVAMVFQNYALYPHMTVAQNLGFGLRMRGLSKEMIEKRIIETARLLAITDLLGRRPKELSGGQRQRVAMGRALVRRPKLFLLDEPLSNLDARLRANVRLELKRLHKKIQTTILYVTHDQVEAMTLGDKVVVMREGKIHQIDRPEMIYNNPADTFVATFIGSPVINLLKGNIINQKGRFVPKTTDFNLESVDGNLNVENGDLEIGIRPEDITVGRKPEGGLKAEVEMVTNVGAEKYVHTRVGSTTLTARAGKEVLIKHGEVIYLGIAPSRLHFFCNGKRI